jgi:hypothetical protein
MSTTLKQVAAEFSIDDKFTQSSKHVLTYGVFYKVWS